MLTQAEVFGSFQHLLIDIVHKGLIQDVFGCIEHNIQPCLVVNNTDAAVHQTNF